MTALVLAGEVSADTPGKRVLSWRCVLAGGETGHLPVPLRGPGTQTG